MVKAKLSHDVEDIEDRVIEENVYSRKNFVKAIYMIGVVGPLLALFQAIKIFSLQTAVGVSLLYWGGYLVVAAMWFGFGIYYKSKAIMVVYGCWIAVEIVILNGVLIYG